MIKLACTADWHLGIAKHSKMEGALPSRTVDSISGVYQIISKANKLKCTHLVVAGDIFHTPTPRPHLLSEAAELLNLFDGDVIAISGNHDPCMLRSRASGPVGVMADMVELKTKIGYARKVVIVDSENYRVDVGEGVYLHLRPYLGKTDKLERVYGVDNSRYNIAVAHHHFQGAVFGSEEMMMAGGVGVSNIEDMGADLILSGHIHKPQEIIYDNVRVLYPGSPARFDFGERSDSKGFWIVNVDGEGDKGISHEFVNIPSRKMVQVVVDDECLEQDDEEIIRLLKKEGVEDADVKPIIRSRNRMTANVAKFKRLLDACKPHYCLNPKIIQNRVERTKVDNIDKDTAIKDCIDSWIETNMPDAGKADREEVKKKAYSVMNGEL